MDKNLKIEHGLFKSFTGSSRLSSDSKIAFATVNGPSNTLAREDNFGPVSIEIKCKFSLQTKQFESMCSGLISKIIDKYIVKDEMMFKTICINVYSNASDLSLICNAVNVACLDAGIAFNSMFYCVGTDPLFVFSNEIVDFYQSFGNVTDQHVEEAKRDLGYIKESIEYAFKAVFTLK